MEAYGNGVSPRTVDGLVEALGADSGFSKSEVSRICGELDEELTAIKDRLQKHTAFPHVFLHATCCRARVNHRTASRTVVIATKISAIEHHAILGRWSGQSGLSECPPLAGGEIRKSAMAETSRNTAHTLG